METDALLVRRAASGDVDAFEALAATHQHRIYALCLRMSGSAQDAQDLAQEALLRIYRNLPSFRLEADFGTWAYRIAANVCIDELRRRRNKETVSMELLREAGWEPLSKDPSPEGESLRRESRRELQQAILQLPEEQRAAVILRDVHGLSYDRVADALSLNMNTVKSRISRGRRRLKEILKEMGSSCEKYASQQ